MAQVRIEYKYLGIKAIPKKWFNGIVVENEYEHWWYKGSEVVDKTELNNRIKELSAITTWCGSKKYRNIKVAS